MSDGQQKQDPTMDEILSSIRKIINEDATRPAAAPTQSAPIANRPESAGPTLGLGLSMGGPQRRGPASAIDDDVLLLTNLIEEAGTAAPPPHPPAGVKPVVAPPDGTPIASPVITRMPVHPAPSPIARPLPDAPPSAAAPAPSLARSTDTSEAAVQPLAATRGATSDQPAAADPIRAAMDRLARAVKDAELPVASPDPGPIVPAGRTLEDIVKDMLRPMLQEWVDTSLPPLVERMIERELQRRTKT